MDIKLLKAAAEQHKELILPPYDLLVEQCGIDAVLAFSHAFGGTNIYVPSARKIFRGCIEQDIVSQSQNINVRALAKRYDFSEQYIRALLKHAV